MSEGSTHCGTACLERVAACHEGRGAARGSLSSIASSGMSGAKAIASPAPGRSPGSPRPRRRLSSSLLPSHRSFVRPEWAWGLRTRAGAGNRKRLIEQCHLLW